MIIFLFTGCIAKNASYEFADRGDIDSMKSYLSDGGNPNVCVNKFGTPISKNRCNPLHVAVFRNHFDMVKFLVENGGDASTKVKYGGDDPLLNMAIERANIEMITYLMDRGASTNNYYIPGVKYGKRSGTSCGYHERMCKAQKYAIEYAKELEIKKQKTKQDSIKKEKNTQIDNLLGL